jgi:hypothetical protein
MLDLQLIRERLVTLAPVLRTVEITADFETASKKSINAPTGFVLELGEAFGANGFGSGQVSQLVTAQFGVVIAAPDLRRTDEGSVLRLPRLAVRQALLGHAPDGCTAIEAMASRLLGAGPVVWWLDSYSTQYIINS